MKKLLLILVLVLLLAGCDNDIGTDSKSNKDNVPQTLTIEINTISDGLETIECDEIFYTNFQQQGLILYRNGEMVKWVVPENLKSYRAQ